MEAKILRGKAFGVPLGGTMVSMDSADITTLLSAASGLAKSLFSFAGKGLLLAMGLGGLYLALRSNKEEEGMRLDIMSKVETSSRSFYGICINEELIITCAGEKLTIPTEYIKKIIYPDSRYGTLYVNLFDGSVYKLDFNRKGTSSLDFLTIIGKQNIMINQNGYGCVFGAINGGTVEEKDVFVRNLNSFLEEKDETIVNLLGKEKFEKFFYPST